MMAGFLGLCAGNAHALFAELGTGRGLDPGLVGDPTTRAFMRDLAVGCGHRLASRASRGHEHRRSSTLGIKLRRFDQSGNLGNHPDRLRTAPARVFRIRQRSCRRLDSPAVSRFAVDQRADMGGTCRVEPGSYRTVLYDHRSDGQRYR